MNDQVFVFISYLDEINSIDTRNKLQDCLAKIIELGGQLFFERVEKEIMFYNLKIIDSKMPEILAKMLLEFFINRKSLLSENLKSLYEQNKLQTVTDDDLDSLSIKTKRFLVAILLGFFTGKKWDGKYSSNGTIVVKEDGEQLAFHVIDLSSLEDYLFENMVFETPSTTRHRYGKIILENNRDLYFKLNLQLRFKK